MSTVRIRWLGVVLALGAILSSCAVAPADRPSDRPRPTGVVPILFVHGHGANRSVFDPAIDYLRAAGYPPEYLMAVDLKPNTGPNAPAAERQIAPSVADLVARTGGGPAAKVDIVAHSMGALSGRWYTARLRPDRVRTLVTVAGANHGTDALCQPADPGSLELCPAYAADPAHAVQAGLNGVPGTPRDETPYGRGVDSPGVPTVAPTNEREIRYVTVRIEPDKWITPARSAKLDGADANLLFTETTDHDAILADEHFLHLLEELLAGSP